MRRSQTDPIEGPRSPSRSPAIGAETAHTVLATVHTLAAALETQTESTAGDTSAA
ncbi:hypothetical protein ACFTZB_45025 [Rhodococcus sp. NPDC057014]|uniref:hypothetical protein n=1 Tax=Rhodococcus sp. NPDC057014 TaxID=3346000 RepID=UPI00363F662C